jgi:hypothetical protein
LTFPALISFVIHASRPFARLPRSRFAVVQHSRAEFTGWFEIDDLAGQLALNQYEGE